MKLKEILADAATYPDNLAMNINGVQVTLAELRGLSAAKQKELSDAEAAANAAKAKFEADRLQLGTAQANTAQLYAAVAKVLEATKTGDYSGLKDDPVIANMYGDQLPTSFGGARTVADDPFAALTRLEADPMLAPLAKTARALQDKLLKSETQYADLLKVTRNMGERYVNDRLTDIYEKVVPEDKQATISLEAVTRHAMQNNLLAGGMPDIKKAYKDMTAGDTAKTREDQIRADERRKVQEEFNANQISVLPGGGSGSGRLGLETHSHPKAGGYHSLDEALEAAKNDKEIWNMSGGVQ